MKSGLKWRSYRFSVTFLATTATFAVVTSAKQEIEAISRTAGGNVRKRKGMNISPGRSGWFH